MSIKVEKTDKTNDNLWLLSEKEMKEAFKFTEDYLNSSYASAITTAYGGTVSYAAYWWLRSPNSYGASGVFGVDPNGYFGTYDVNHTDLGVRPAFLF